MDMAELAARTGLPVRKLRYVFDRVLPGLRGASAGHGVPRTFTDYEAFGIALAARLLDAGVARKTVAAALGAACRPRGSTHAPGEVPLFRAYTLKAGTLEIGDGRYLRLRAPKRPGLGNALDTGWLPLGPSERVTGNYIPVVQVTVELGGLVWFHKKDYDKAIADYDEAIKLDPKYTHAYFHRGLAWLWKKDYDKAIRDYTEAIRLNPKDPDSFVGRGLAWRAKGEFEKAEKDFAEAKRLRELKK